MILRQLLYYFTAVAVLCILFLTSLVVSEYHVISEYKNTFSTLLSTLPEMPDEHDFLNHYKAFLKASSRGGNIYLTKNNRNIFSIKKITEKSYLSSRYLYFQHNGYFSVMKVPLLQLLLIRQLTVIFLGSSLLLLLASASYTFLSHQSIQLFTNDKTRLSLTIPDSVRYVLTNEIQRTLSSEQDLIFLLAELDTQSTKTKCEDLFKRSGLSYDYLYCDINEITFAVIVPDIGFDEFRRRIQLLKKKIVAAKDLKSFICGFSSTQSRIVSADQLYRESYLSLSKCKIDTEAMFYGFKANADQYDSYLIDKW